jgi:arginine/lysine/histidine transport system permease protein
MGYILMELLKYGPLFARGSLITLSTWLLASFMSLIFGNILGILNCRKLKTPLIAKVITAYVLIIKGIPLYVLLLLSYFVVPELLGINPSALIVCTITLSFCSAAYIAEIVRAGINNIPDGQWEACGVLGYSRLNMLWRVILPQMIRNALPALMGEFDQILKSTALFAALGVVELTKTTMNIVSRELNPLPMYGLLAVLYLSMSLFINSLGKKLERRRNYDLR